MNIKRVLVATLAGAVVAFVWALISWMALPWHHADFRSFKDADPVAEHIMEQSRDSGFYMLPNAIVKDRTQEKHNQWMKDAAKGPYALIILRKEGMKISFPMQLAKMFLMQFATALLLTLLLAQTSIQSVLRKAVFVTTAALAGGMLVHLANWGWWGFPIATTMVEIVDLIITWFLAGLAIGKLYKTN